MDTIRIRHILVQHRYEAEDLLLLLRRGALFEDLARKYSNCSSARDGGDLGIFLKGRFVEEFDEAVTDLSVGTWTPQPIRTKFGFHLIYRYE